MNPGVQRRSALGSPTITGVLPVALAVLATAALIRVLEWPAWVASPAWRDGQPILPNVDAYAWMAGAEGTGRMAGWPLSQLLAALATASGQPLEWVGFWLPMALAGCSGLLVAWLCARRGYPAAGLTAGILAGSSLGYLARTRLGHADTDLFALTLAVALAWAWASLARQLAEREGLSTGGQTPSLRLLAALAICWLSIALYPSGYVLTLAVVVVGLGYGLARGGRQVLQPVLLVLTAALLSLHFGLVGLVLAVALAGLLTSGRLPLASLGSLGLLALAILAVVVLESVSIEQSLRRVGTYTGVELAVSPVRDWRLPSVDASIQETGRLGLAALAERIANHWLLFVAGFAGLMLVLRRWPELMTFLPLLGLGLGGLWWGPRFAMYASVPLALGLGLGLALAMEHLRIPPRLRLTLQLLLAIAVLLFIGWRALEPRPDPALAPGHVDALLDLRAVEVDRGRVWSWWDRGYAAQFYAGLPTLADGGSASRQRIFALGQVFGGSSALQAAQVMKLGALARVESDQSNWIEAAYQTHPLQMLSRMPAELAQQELDRLATGERLWPEALPDEFLVVDWHTLRQAQWISYFGRWRLDKGEQGFGQVQTLRPPVELDEQRGLMHTAEGTVQLLSLDILEDGSRYHNRWPHAQGAHAVINNTNGQGVLLDSSLYGLMAVQMLIGDPEAFEPHFELVSDHAPAARVYRLR